MLVLTVLPDRGDDHRVALRKHMRWALTEVIGPLRAHTHATASLKGRLAENVDAVMDLGATEPYGVAIVAGARLFLALALMLRPTVRPAKYVVFLGAEDVETLPTPVQEPRRRAWGCGCRAVALPPAPANRTTASGWASSIRRAQAAGSGAARCASSKITSCPASRSAAAVRRAYSGQCRGGLAGPVARAGGQRRKTRMLPR